MWLLSQQHSLGADGHAKSQASVFMLLFRLTGPETHLDSEITVRKALTMPAGGPEFNPCEKLLGVWACVWRAVVPGGLPASWPSQNREVNERPCLRTRQWLLRNYTKLAHGFSRSGPSLLARCPIVPGLSTTFLFLCVGLAYKSGPSHRPVALLLSPFPPLVLSPYRPTPDFQLFSFLCLYLSLSFALLWPSL